MSNLACAAPIAIQRALVNEDHELAETRWSDALSSGSEPTKWGGVRFGSRIVDSRTRDVDLPAAAAPEDAVQPAAADSDLPVFAGFDADPNDVTTEGQTIENATAPAIRGDTADDSTPLAGPASGGLFEDEEKGEFLAELGLDEPGLDRGIHAGYKLLGLQTYFTAGVKEVRAWTVKIGATAPQAAGVIHTDFEKGFIRAETIAYDDYIGLGGETGAKDAGKMRLEGKEYVVKDGDVMHFRFAN